MYIGTDIVIDIDSDLAVSIAWGSFKKVSKAPWELI